MKNGTLDKCHILACECKRRYVIGKICNECFKKMLYTGYNDKWMEELKQYGVDYNFIRSNKITMFNSYIFNNLDIWIVKKYTYCLLEENYINDMIFFCNDCIENMKYSVNMY